jgi:hypothetical protein
LFQTFVLVLVLVTTALQFAISRLLSPRDRRIDDTRPSDVTPQNLEALVETGWSWYVNIPWPLRTIVISSPSSKTAEDILEELYGEYGEDYILLGVPLNHIGKPTWREQDVVGVYIWSDDGGPDDDDVPDPEPDEREMADRDPVGHRANFEIIFTIRSQDDA